MNEHGESGQPSETTSWQPLAIGVSGSIGSRRGELGVGRPLPASATLAQLPPAQTDTRLVAALERISGQRVGFEKRTMIPNDGPVYSVVTGIDWSPSEAVAGQALDLIDGAFRSAPEDQISAAVYRLRMLTRGREQRDAADQEAEAVIWIEQLRCYPGDIVLDVLREWPARRNGQFWPTWSEVRAELEKLAAPRIALASHAHRIACGKGAKQIEPPREEWCPTVADLKALFGETWGIVGERAEVQAHMTPEERKTASYEHAVATAREFRENPPQLSSTLREKLEREGHISPASRAA